VCRIAFATRFASTSRIRHRVDVEDRQVALDRRTELDLRVVAAARTSG
jgi:hypothetical protein